MFMNAPDPMRMEPTPERVLAVCRFIAGRDMSRADLQDAMTLGTSGGKAVPEVTQSLAVAQNELELIQEKDGLLLLAVPEEVIASPASFRRAIAGKVFARKKSTFYLFTKWVISQNERIFSLGKWEALALTARDEVADLSGTNENAGLGWRFWAAFLGIGYLSGTIILPNMKIRLQDVLAEYGHDYEYDNALAAKDFIRWLSGKLPEVDFQEPIPLALSAGLRTLNDLQLIRLEIRPDTERIPLYYVDGDRFNEFSNISVRKEVCV